MASYRSSCSQTNMEGKSFNAGRSAGSPFSCCQLRKRRLTGLAFFWLFESMRVEPTLFFELGFSLQLVGVSLCVPLNL